MHHGLFVSGSVCLNHPIILPLLVCFSVCARLFHPAPSLQIDCHGYPLENDKKMQDGTYLGVKQRIFSLGLFVLPEGSVYNGTSVASPCFKCITIH